uniref:Uncharacterized protein n=1 Tax=Triticum urartu TaxID=4572 RepID=A0A8R7Q1G8_TRIUA
MQCVLQVKMHDLMCGLCADLVSNHPLGLNRGQYFDNAASATS